jgi:hypothetical protein
MREVRRDHGTAADMAEAETIGQTIDLAQAWADTAPVRSEEGQRLVCASRDLVGADLEVRGTPPGLG